MLIMTKGYGKERDDTLFCDSSVYTFLLYFTKFYLCVPDSADIIKLPEEMKDVQRRLRSGSLLFCCVRRRMMAVKRDWRKNSIKTIRRGKYRWKIRSYILGKGVGVVRGWCRLKKRRVGDDSKNSQKTGIGVTFAPESCSYIVGENYAIQRACEKEGRGIDCLVSDTTLRHNTTFSIIYIFFFYSCNRTRARIYTRIYRNRVSLVSCVGLVAQTGGKSELDFLFRKEGRGVTSDECDNFLLFIHSKNQKGKSRHIRIYAYI